MKQPEELLAEVRDLSRQLPEYARLVALFWVKELSKLVQTHGTATDLDILGQGYRRAVAAGLEAGVGLSAEEAGQEVEFYDFYIRHGILANMLGNAVFSLAQLPDQRWMDEGMTIVNSAQPLDVR